MTSGGWAPEGVDPHDWAIYMGWLHGEVGRHCNGGGLYEVGWDDGECLDPDDVADAVTGYRGMGLESPEEYVYQRVNDRSDLLFQAEDDLVEAIDADASVLPDGALEAYVARRRTGGFWDDMSESGYGGVDVMEGELIANTELCVNLMLATSAERNHDHASIVGSFGNAELAARPGGRVGPDAAEDSPYLDNALAWLANQQGHSVKELMDAVACDGGGRTPFLRSAAEEVRNNPSEAMSELTVLVRARGYGALDLLDRCERGAGCLVLPVDMHPTVGIFNEWAGGGSLMGIELDRDMVVPLALVSGWQIEGQSAGGWTVAEVYGVGDARSWWKDGWGVSEDVPAPAMESVRGAERGEDEAAGLTGTTGTPGASEVVASAEGARRRQAEAADGAPPRDGGAGRRGGARQGRNP